MKPFRDTAGRFAKRPAAEPAKITPEVTSYKIPEDVWVRFQIGPSACGCGNRTFHGMETRKELAKGKNPFGYSNEYNSPNYGMKLTEVWDWIKKHYNGREIHLVFKRVAKLGKHLEFFPHFNAYEFMELLESHPESVVRVREFCNTIHSPANHLRSYSIHIVGTDYHTHKRYDITDEMREAM